MRSARRSSAFDLDVWSILLIIGVLVMLALCVAAPLMGTAGALLHADPSVATPVAPFAWDAAARTLGYSVLIAAISTLLALPAGWCLRAPSHARAALLCVPLLLPPYLAYSGWGVLRGPGTWLGDRLAGADPSLTVLAGRVLSVFGLALWAYPIAAITIGLVARRVPDALLDALRLEPASRPRAAREVLRMLAPGCLLGTALVALVTMGSAVPLHLAQVQTLAIHLWKYMSLTPESIRAWLGAWPLLILAIVGAIGVLHWFSRITSAHDAAETPQHRPGPWVLAGAMLVWACAVLAPLALNLWTLRDWSLVPAFWSTSARAITNSLQTGAIVGACSAFICAAVWRLAADRAGAAFWLARAATGLLVACMLTPGVLLGAAGVALTCAPWFPERLVHTNAVLVAVHVARFGAIGALVGVWLAAQETQDERASRALYAAGTPGWARTQLARAWSAPVGVALAAGALSVHEIEATVLVAPPGPGNLAQRLLDLLHYARDDQLAAANINITVLGLLVALAAAALIAHAERTTR